MIRTLYDPDPPGSQGGPGPGKPEDAVMPESVSRGADEQKILPPAQENQGCRIQAANSDVHGGRS
jgi:hypothetical protein